MTTAVLESEASNFELFRDCLSTPLIEKSLGAAAKRSKRRRGPKLSGPGELECNVITHDGKEAEELGEFVDVRD